MPEGQKHSYQGAVLATDAMEEFSDEDRAIIAEKLGGEDAMNAELTRLADLVLSINFDE